MCFAVGRAKNIRLIGIIGDGRPKLRLWVTRRHADCLAGTAEVPERADGIAALPKNSGVPEGGNWDHAPE